MVIETVAIQAGITLIDLEHYIGILKGLQRFEVYHRTLQQTL